MQRLLILFILVTSAFCGYSQFNIKSSRIYGGSSLDEFKDIGINADTSRIFWGARTFSTDGDIPSNAGGSDYWIQKWDSDENLLWSKTFGGFNNDDLTTVMPHPDGGVIAFGTTNNDHGIFGSLHGVSGGWLMRTNTNGEMILGQIFGSGLSETAVDAHRHATGNITIAMEGTSALLNGQVNHGSSDVWIVNVDPIFNIRWSALMGGTLKDVPTAMASDANSNIYVVATSYSDLADLDPNAGGADVWVFKLSPQGILLWQKNFGGSNDDMGSDILFHPAGYVYVTAHSVSNDGDFDSNSGSNDIWIIKMDIEDGATSTMVHYGGEGNDVNAHLERYGSQQLVMSATTSSSTGDLTGNKGFNDVWVMTTDLNANKIHQMNYGGSVNDVAADLTVIDSVFILLNTSQSSDKNVPPNSFSQQDLWYLTLDANAPECADYFKCIQDSTLANELFPPSDNVLLCVDGCNAGLAQGPFFVQGPCADFENATAIFKLTTDATADLLTISVSSDEINQPQIGLLISGNCSTYFQVACATGSDGFVLLQYTNVTPLATYVIAVSDAEGNEGNFSLCATAIDVEFCNERDRLYVIETSSGSPLQGPYEPGEDVTFCYELLDWNKLDCNGFQGLVPTFGPGWDPSNFDIFGMPIEIDSMIMPVSNGFWDWYKLGDVRYNISNPINGYNGGQGMPPGWYFTNLSDPPPNTDPDETVGDIYDCLPTPDKWKICFTLKALEECETSLDASVSMRTFSDGEIGSRESLACAYDQGETWTASMICCQNPGIAFIGEQTMCSEDTLILVPETNIQPPVTYSWIAYPDAGVQGSFSQNNAVRFYQILTNETDVVLNVRYELWAEGDGCQTKPVEFNVRVLPSPSSRLTLTGPSIICSGSTVTLNFESVGTPPFAIELFRDNVFYANVLSETSILTINVDPVFTSRFRIGNMRDAFCEGDGLGIVNVTVKPVGSSVIDTTVCEGESFVVGNEVFTESGIYTINLGGAAANDCDSIVSLTLTVIPPTTEDVIEEICVGDTVFVLGDPYTEPTDEIIEYFGPEGCPNYIHLVITIRDTLVTTIDQSICAGDTLDFGGTEVYQSGTYTHLVESSPGCFERTTLHLTVLPEIFINDLSITGDDGTNSGIILVEIVGGTPPFTYLWNTGATTESLFNIKHGSYTLTATDSRGCRETFNFVVPMATGTRNPIISNQDLKVWPSIVTSGEKINIFSPSGKMLEINEIQWWDVNGRLVSSRQVDLDTSTSVSIDVPQIPSGNLYFLRIKLEDGATGWFKIISQ